VVRSTSSFLGGAWTDRLGAERTMWIGWVCYALLAGGMAYAHTTLQAWGLFLALGVVAGLTESPERALVARTAGAHQGSGFGAYHALTGFAALAGGLVLGGVFQAYGRPAVLGRGAGRQHAVSLGTDRQRPRHAPARGHRHHGAGASGAREHQGDARLRRQLARARGEVHGISRGHQGLRRDERGVRDLLPEGS